MEQSLKIGFWLSVVLDLMNRDKKLVFSKSCVSDATRKCMLLHSFTKNQQFNKKINCLLRGVVFILEKTTPV